MSVPDTPATPPAPPPPPRKEGLGGCLVVILVLIGIVLILPGVCSLVVLATSGSAGDIPGAILVLWAITFLIAAAGVLVIRYAIRNR